MSLSSLILGPFHPRQNAEELLNEWLKSYFDGGSHPVSGTDVVFPTAALLFNVASLPKGQIVNGVAQLQIHTVFNTWRVRDRWYAHGDLETWRSPALASPLAGVQYGATTNGHVEESVHGKSARRLDGQFIRWRTAGSDLVEEVSGDGSAWTNVRTFAGGSAIRWIYTAGEYREQVLISGTWTTVRTVEPIDAQWDGSKRLVEVDSLMTFFIRAPFAGEANSRTSFAARSGAELLVSLMRDPQVRRALREKGFRRLEHEQGPVTLATAGYATEFVVATTGLRFFVPLTSGM